VVNPGNEANGWELPPEHDDPPDIEPTCHLCGSGMEWETCPECDDGFVDEYDEDPINCDPGDERPCSECDGRGGYWVCPRVPHATPGIA
jgi:hypothetical protein